jgi:demethylmenaquinone methyltransferase/2-methoxy-6-polyprenyl-1,4-benzoquinol methylase
MDDPYGGDRLSGIIASQREFYDQRAPDFGDVSVPDRKVTGYMASGLAGALIDEFAPTGDVLELACGTGSFTRELVRHATNLTALDGSGRMLERNRAEVGDERVTYVEADLFAWRPDRRYDAVFFGFWLSHVPPSAFDAFWELVAASLAPGGRVAFVDEDGRAAGYDDVRVVDGVPLAARTLRDGRRYDVVKLFWEPAALQDSLHSIGWRIDVRAVGGTYLYGCGTPPST